MALLSAPTYFKLKETKPGTVLVTSGTLVKEDESTKYKGVRQFYFQDSEDSKLKCLTGGSLAYVIDLHDIDKNKVVKITYGGTQKIENGKFSGNEAHQFEVDLLEDNTPSAPSVNEVDANGLE
tara:strand:- start:1284 stop:1652 length:369 start_codon:yes stop_codon:yes gene_type:complete